MINKHLNASGERDPLRNDDERSADLLCEQWITWSQTRRLYGPAPRLAGTLGKIAISSRPLRHIERDAVSSAELSALHIAYTCQPDALDRKVFEAYYMLRIRPIKRAADTLGISRKHFYTVLKDFRRRLIVAARALQKINERHAETIGNKSHDEGAST